MIMDVASTLQVMPIFVDHVVEAHGSRWSVTTLSDGAFAVDELSASSPSRGGCFTPTFCRGRASSIEDVVQMAIDHSALDSEVIQDVCIALLGGMILLVGKDDELPIALSVGPYIISTEDVKRFVCIQDPNGKLLLGQEEYDVSDPHTPYICARTFVNADWSAFGAARTFVSFVGRVRAREAIRRARDRCCAA
jgi:hypothetical protein